MKILFVKNTLITNVLSCKGKPKNLPWANFMKFHHFKSYSMNSSSMRLSIERDLKRFNSIQLFYSEFVFPLLQLTTLEQLNATTSRLTYFFQKFQFFVDYCSNYMIRHSYRECGFEVTQVCHILKCHPHSIQLYVFKWTP